MKKKSRKYSLIKIVSSVLLVILFACSKSNTPDYQIIDDNLKVDNIELSMNETQVLNTIKAKYTEESCVLGKELIFKDLDLDIVFDLTNQHIKRLITKNKSSSLYGMKINDPVTSLSDILLKEGYVSDAGSKYKYLKDDFRITILSLDGIKISGFMIDVLDE